MSQNTQKNENLRRYLLGILESEAKEAVEEQFVTDDNAFQLLEIEEERLTEDYVAKRLTSKEEKLFLENFLISDKRRQDLLFERSLPRYAKENPAPEIVPVKTETETEKKKYFKGFFSRLPSWSLAGAIGFLVLVAFAAVFWNSIYTSSEKNVLLALNKAYQKKRPFDARISGFDYAPLDNLRGAGKSEVDTISSDRAQSLSFEAVEKAKTADSLHSLGRVYLARKEFDKATEQLQNAATLAPQNAEIISDLGTAYFEKGKILISDQSGARIDLFFKALDNFEKALALSPESQTAQFNKAICLQTLNQTNQAREAWQNYLKLDGDSAWADEARHNLQRIETETSQSATKEQILKDFMDAFDRDEPERAWQILNRNREMISGKLVPQQLAGSFLTADKDSRERYLKALKYASALEKKKSGDLYFAEIGEFYSHLSEDQIHDLQLARDSINRGYEFCRKNQYENAAREFSGAHSAFKKNGDELDARLADYWIAYANSELTNIAESYKQFKQLAEFCRLKNYKWLESNALARLALNTFVRGKHSETIKYNEEALKLAGETSDLYLREKVLSQLAEQYQILGQYDESLRYLQQSFALLSYPETSPRQKWRTYAQSIELLAARKYYAAARNIINESIALNTNEIKDKTYTYSNYSQLSEIHRREQKYIEALKFANLSIEAAREIDGEKPRSKAVAAALLNLGHLQERSGDYPNAIKSYDSTIDLFNPTEFSLYNYEARRGRLSCYVQLKDESAIATELPAVLTMFEANRPAILEEQNRNSFFDNGNDIYDLAVGYEFDKKNYEKAFDYSEESRSRSLLDLQKNGAKVILNDSKPEIIFDEKVSQPHDLSQIQATMSDEVQILEYSILSDKLIIWLVTKNSVKTFSTNVSQENLDEKVSSFSQAVKNKETEKQNLLARELYSWLIAPLTQDLDGAKEICLIPDKFLFDLPFAALISNKTNNFLIADYKLLVAPSTNVFLASTENAKMRSQEKSEKLLSVGNPDFDRREFADLPELPAAEKEAQQIATLYDHSTVLLKRDATKKNLEAAISRSDVFHFAGHYVADAQSPLLSGFLIAGDEKESILTNYELLEGKFRKPKLIILSACQTGAEGYYKGEGMIGAGRIFLAAGVPEVVGSFWQVDSDATAELMQKFHYYRKQENLSTVAAMREAQLAMLNSPNENFRQPFYWAGFLTIGGYAQF